MMENIELSECIYEHIKDTFYYGVFGDFKLVIDKATGRFNATKLCDAGGKEYRQWTRLEKSKRMIEYYQNRGGDSHGNFIYEVKGANKNKIEKRITGQYVPKELILDIASWVSIEFYDRCNNIIINYFVKEFKDMDDEALNQKIKEVEDSMEQLILENENKNLLIRVKDDKIDELKELILKQNQERDKDREYLRFLGISLGEVKDQNEELLDETKELKKQNKKIQRKMGVAVEDRAPQPDNETKRERFVLIKRNDPDYYAYYTVRAQDSYTTRKLKFEKTNFPNLVVLLDFKCSPNSKTLYTRIKENLKAKNVMFKGNNIELEDTDITEEQLVKEMKVINEAKRNV